MYCQSMLGLDIDFCISWAISKCQGYKAVTIGNTKKKPTKNWIPTSDGT